jgi:hypothetical protein
MKLWAALTSAGQGWLDILRGREGWQSHFALSAGGLVSALAIYFFFAFLAIAFGSISGGMPGLVGVLLGLLVQALSVVALLIGIISAKIAVKSPVPLLALLVPGVYALVFYLLAGTILASVSTDLVALALLLVLLLFYRLGQIAGVWSIGVALAFAVFTTLLLVAMPLTLYMLTQPAMFSS